LPFALAASALALDFEAPPLRPMAAAALLMSVLMVLNGFMRRLSLPRSIP
jgi:hypothetical protein